MAKHDPDLSRLFQALADPTRRSILSRLAEGPAPVTELAHPTGLRLPTVMRHLGVLEEAGLVTREKRGQFVYFRQVPDRLANTLMSWAAEVCPVAGPLKREARGRGKPDSTK